MNSLNPINRNRPTDLNLGKGAPSSQFVDSLSSLNSLHAPLATQVSALKFSGRVPASPSTLDSVVKAHFNTSLSKVGLLHDANKALHEAGYSTIEEPEYERSRIRQKLYVGGIVPSSVARKQRQQSPHSQLLTASNQTVIHRDNAATSPLNPNVIQGPLPGNQTSVLSSPTPSSTTCTSSPDVENRSPGNKLKRSLRSSARRASFDARVAFLRSDKKNNDTPAILQLLRVRYPRVTVQDIERADQANRKPWGSRSHSPVIPRENVHSRSTSFSSQDRGNSQVVAASSALQGVLQTTSEPKTPETQFVLGSPFPGQARRSSSPMSLSGNVNEESIEATQPETPIQTREDAVLTSNSTLIDQSNQKLVDSLVQKYYPKTKNEKALEKAVNDELASTGNLLRVTERQCKRSRHRQGLYRTDNRNRKKQMTRRLLQPALQVSPQSLQPVSPHVSLMPPAEITPGMISIAEVSSHPAVVTTNLLVDSMQVDRQTFPGQSVVMQQIPFMPIITQPETSKMGQLNAFSYVPPRVPPPEVFSNDVLRQQNMPDFVQGFRASSIHSESNPSDAFSYRNSGPFSDPFSSPGRPTTASTSIYPDTMASTPQSQFPTGGSDTTSLSGLSAFDASLKLSSSPLHFVDIPGSTANPALPGFEDWNFLPRPIQRPGTAGSNAPSVDTQNLGFLTNRAEQGKGTEDGAHLKKLSEKIGFRKALRNAAHSMNLTFNPNDVPPAQKLTEVDEGYARQLENESKTKQDFRSFKFFESIRKSIHGMRKRDAHWIPTI